MAGFFRKIKVYLRRAVFIVSVPIWIACGAAQRGAGSTNLLRVQGDKIVDPSGKEVQLQGMAFGNRVWLSDPVPTLHHDERDYQRVAEMGMNTIRFYLNYLTFEAPGSSGSYKDSGWEWLDRNVAWAKQHGIYLVLNMHVPPGGFQSHNKGKALWEDPSAQERLIMLWRAIARRYRDEPVIAGYDLLNEPVVSRSREQWHDLAARLIKAVREEDPGHILFIERVNAINGDWQEDEDRNFFLVDDPNVVYEFHFYKPLHFTHQGAPWADFVAQETRYPDPERVGVEWFLTERETSSFQNPTLPEGDSDWAYYEGVPFKISSSKWMLGKPVLACGPNTGKAYFDDLVIEQLGEDGSVVKEIRRINPETSRGWYFRSQDGRGDSRFEREGHGDFSSLSITGSAGDISVDAEIYMFPTEQNAVYRFSGWMKGEGISPNARCQIRLDFLSSKVPIQRWDKKFLAQELGAYISWGRKHGVPLFLGEFGTIANSFREDRGGERWTADMLDLLLENNIHFTYHDYHDPTFGVFLNGGSLPDPKHANEALINLFKEKLVPVSSGGPGSDKPESTPSSGESAPAAQ